VLCFTGLRAIKTVLRHAGQLIHSEKRKVSAKAAGGDTASAAAGLSLEVESSLLIGALKINTLSKLTFADSVRFNGLIGDVFPQMKDEDIDYGQLTAVIRTAIEELKLEYVESQVRKILQLYEALNQRMGVVIVGPSGCGTAQGIRMTRRGLNVVDVEKGL